MLKFDVQECTVNSVPMQCSLNVCTRGNEKEKEKFKAVGRESDDYSIYTC
jgi:hypothetical protein